MTEIPPPAASLVPAQPTSGRPAPDAPPPDPPPDPPPEPPGLGRLISAATSVVAPLSLLSALLFYFGYASARAQYEYFGIDVDAIGLSTQDYVMRSPQPLLVPVLALALLAVALTLAHAAVRRRIDTELARTDDEAGGELGAARRLGRAGMRAGQAGLAAGVVLLFGFPYLREWTPYPLATPLLIALGAAVAGYGMRIEELAGRRARTRRAALVSLFLVLAAGVFWATATLAQWSGRGSAHYAAEHLDRLPAVILDTRERLYLTSPGIVEKALIPEEGQAFHYRYRGLRLLIQGHDRLFLVPDRWSASNSTLVLPFDAAVRVQFRFQNQPP